MRTCAHSLWCCRQPEMSLALRRTAKLAWRAPARRAAKCGATRLPSPPHSRVGASAAMSVSDESSFFDQQWANLEMFGAPPAPPANRQPALHRHRLPIRRVPVYPARATACTRACAAQRGVWRHLGRGRGRHPAEGGRACPALLCVGRHLALARVGAAIPGVLAPPSLVLSCCVAVSPSQQRA